MRFMIIVKATKDSETEFVPTDPKWKPMFAEMEKYHEELQRAGALLDYAGLQRSAKGWRIKYSGGKRTVIDGPFTEAKELVAGYTLIQVKSREEALEWARRFPNPALTDGEIEVRQLYELDDFGPSEAPAAAPNSRNSRRDQGVFMIRYWRSFPESASIPKWGGVDFTHPCSS